MSELAEDKGKLTYGENQIVVYQTLDGSTKIYVRLENNTVWLNRQQMTILFDRTITTIGKHIKNAQVEELQGLQTVAKFATVQTEGNRNVKRYIEYCNLDMIFSVGYRVKSRKGIEFRIWANRILKKGYTNDTRHLRVITDYTYALDTLDKYDYQQLSIEKTTVKETFRAT